MILHIKQNFIWDLNSDRAAMSKVEDDKIRNCSNCSDTDFSTSSQMKSKPKLVTQDQLKLNDPIVI